MRYGKAGNSGVGGLLVRAGIIFIHAPISQFPNLYPARVLQVTMAK